MDATRLLTQYADAGEPARASARLRRTVYSAAQWPRVAAQWSRLFRADSRYSFFLSEAWVEVWIQVFAAKLDISIVLFEDADEPVGVCLLVKTKPRHAMIPLRRISLNAAGEDSADTTYIEFNNLLCRPGWEESIAPNLAEYVNSQQWDELALDGFLPGPAYDALKRAFAQYDLEESWHPSYYVDLAALRRSAITYEMALSSHRRKILRQTLRAYSKLGAIRLEPARDLDEALTMFDEMARLNKGRWATRGRLAVYDSPYFTAFHRHLIRRCFEAESVQLLRLTAGQQTVGLLYNLVERGKVYFYQCGFDYGIDKRLSPGMVTISHAIQYCIGLGLDDWDLLSGDASYKRLLSTGSRQLVWAVFRKASPNVRIVQTLRAGKRLVHALQGRTSGRNTK
jgi:CelD/BcsL family acetyltransferase involved in cellulose biosynthesis